MAGTAGGAHRTACRCRIGRRQVLVIGAALLVIAGVTVVASYALLGRAAATLAALFVLAMLLAPRRRAAR